MFAGQVTVTNIAGGSARWAQVGYWIDRRHAGQGVIPTAVALVVDYCLFELGLHRIEVAIRPENTASLRVVEKLGFTEIGYAPGYLHIDGDWRDHRLFAVTAEDIPGGMLPKFKGSDARLTSPRRGAAVPALFEVLRSSSGGASSKPPQARRASPAVSPCGQRDSRRSSSETVGGRA